MKTTIIIVLIIIAVVLFGSFPLSILGKVFDFISNLFTWLAKILNLFGWNGMI